MTRPIVLAGMPPLHSAFADPPPHWGPVPCALISDGKHFEVIPENTWIHQFTWEHLNDINCVLQCVKKAGGTFLGCKMDIYVPEVVAIGHHCTYEGHYPEDSKVQKIVDWPDCNALMEV